MLARLDATITEATTAFDGFDYARALERTEAFFWWFCDDFVELVKGRAYGGRGPTPRRRPSPACRSPSSALQRLLAPMLPFATEEAWSWSHDTSIHAAVVAGGQRHRRPVRSISTSSARCWARCAGRRPRPSRASGRASPRSTVTVPAAARPALEAARADLVEALTVVELELVDGADFATDIHLV